MVLLLKHRKSRTSPGFAAGARKSTRYAGSSTNPFTLLKTGRSRKAPQGRTAAAPYWRVSQANGCSRRRLRPTQVVAGWSSPVARQAHNLKVVGSNPTPATNKTARLRGGFFVPAAHQGCWGNAQSIGARPLLSRKALALEKCLQPRNPLCAEKGEGWAALSTRCLPASTNSALRCA